MIQHVEQQAMDLLENKQWLVLHVVIYTYCYQGGTPMW